MRMSYDPRKARGKGDGRSKQGGVGHARMQVRREASSCDSASELSPTENWAATRIQAWWRGLLACDDYQDMKARKEKWEKRTEAKSEAKAAPRDQSAGLLGNTPESFRKSRIRWCAC